MWLHFLTGSATHTHMCPRNGSVKLGMCNYKFWPYPEIFIFVIKIAIGFLSRAKKERLSIYSLWIKLRAICGGDSYYFNQIKWHGIKGFFSALRDPQHPTLWSQSRKLRRLKRKEEEGEKNKRTHKRSRFELSWQQQVNEKSSFWPSTQNQFKSAKRLFRPTCHKVSDHINRFFFLG